jgi:hypothetical protein
MGDMSQVLHDHQMKRQRTRRWERDESLKLGSVIHGKVTVRDNIELLCNHEKENEAIPGGCSTYVGPSTPKISGQLDHGKVVKSQNLSWWSRAQSNVRVRDIIELLCDCGKKK